MQFIWLSKVILFSKCPDIPISSLEMCNNINYTCWQERYQFVTNIVRAHALKKYRAQSDMTSKKQTGKFLWLSFQVFFAGQ